MHLSNYFLLQSLQTIEHSRPCFLQVHLLVSQLVLQWQLMICNADALSRIPCVEHCYCYMAGHPETLPCRGCDHCSKVTESWARFESDVDDILPLVTLRTLTFADQNPSSDTSWIGGYSSADLKTSQFEDAHIKILHEWKETGQPPCKEDIMLESPVIRHYWLCFNQIEMLDGVLYYRWEGTSGDVRRLLLVPDSMKTDILKLCHQSILAGHPGIARTKEKSQTTLLLVGTVKGCCKVCGQLQFVSDSEGCSSEAKGDTVKLSVWITNGQGTVGYSWSISYIIQVCFGHCRPIHQMD